MDVFTHPDRFRDLVHISEDAWMTRCGVRAARAASHDDLVRFGECTRCRISLVAQSVRTESGDIGGTE